MEEEHWEAEMGQYSTETVKAAAEESLERFRSLVLECHKDLADEAVPALEDVDGQNRG